MAQIRPEEVQGLVRTETHKGDRNSDKPYTAVTSDGRRVALSKDEAASLQKRLDKDRSRMERSGTRAPEREPERREPSRVATEADRRRFMEQFKKGG